MSGSKGPVQAPLFCDFRLFLQVSTFFASFDPGLTWGFIDIGMHCVPHAGRRLLEKTLRKMSIGLAASFAMGISDVERGAMMSLLRLREEP